MMTALQAGLLQWLAVSLAFCLGWLYGALFSQSASRSRLWTREMDRKARKVRRAEKASAQEAARNTQGRRALLPGLRGTVGGVGGFQATTRSPITQRRKVQ